MKVLLTLAMLAALSTSAFAEPPDAEEPAPVFNIIEADASLPFSNHRIQSFHVARDNSLILRAGANRWYRATVWAPCAHDLRWAHENIALDTRPNGTLDRFSAVVVRGQRCPIRTLDRIDRPGPETSY